jgi:hypothetical protein
MTFVYGRHEGPAYINSGSIGFYRSDPYESQSGEAVEPKLKAKYRVGGLAPKFNKHSDNGGNARNKIPRPDSAGEPRVMFMFDALRGKTQMMTVSDFLEIKPGWDKL